MSNSSDFSIVSKTSAFVDKSMLIKYVFEANERTLITAPGKFGKSTNLNMIKQFLTLASESKTEIRETFQKLKIYENNSSFFRNNFGKHPVLNVNFECVKTKSYEDAVSCYKRAIHCAFLEHNYLIHSAHLTEDDKTLCSTWCDKRCLVQQHEERITYALADLVRMLKEHFKHKVIVLIDEYDCVINNALFKVKSKAQFERILALTSEIISRVLKVYKNVLRAIITGVSCISTTGLREINNLDKYQFLGNHMFVDFYGLTESEVRNLLHKDEFKSQSHKNKLAKKLYNGYVCKRGRQIYNTFSFLTFLKTNEAIAHWETVEYASGITRMLEEPEVAKSIKVLLDGQSINFSVYNNSVSDVLELRSIYLNDSMNVNSSSNLLLSHLLELGLLTYNQTLTNSCFNNGDRSNNVQVTIPNQEAYGIIFSIFRHYWFEKCDVSFETADYETFIERLVAWCKPKRLLNNLRQVFVESAAEAREKAKSILDWFKG